LLSHPYLDVFLFDLAIGRKERARQKLQETRRTLHLEGILVKFSRVWPPIVIIIHWIITLC